MGVRQERLVLAVEHALVDGVAAVHHRPTRPRGRALLLFHGAGGDLDQPRLVALAGAVAARGHPVVRANLPWREAGRGRAPAAERAVPGLTAVLAAARGAAGPRRGWVVGGASYGGRVATLAVAEGAVRVDGVLCVGYPLHPPGRPERLRVAHWPQVRVPVLFVQGTRDAFGGPEELAPHLPTLGAGHRLEVVVGADHGLVVAGRHAPDGVRRLGPEVATRLGPVVAAFLDRPGEPVRTPSHGDAQ